MAKLTPQTRGYMKEADTGSGLPSFSFKTPQFTNIQLGQKYNTHVDLDKSYYWTKMSLENHTLGQK